MHKSVLTLFAWPLGLSLGCAGIGEMPLPPDAAHGALVAAPPGAKAAAAVPLAPAPSAPFSIRDLAVAPSSSLSKTIAKLDLPQSEQTALIASLEAQIDPSHLAAGTHLKALTLRQGDLLPTRVELELSATNVLTSEHCGQNTWITSQKRVPVEHHSAAFSGLVTTTLWNSAGAAGMDQQLAAKLTEVFAWQFDSSRDVHRGDRWRMTIDRLYVGGKPVGYGDIIAAEYSKGTTLFAAVRFDTDGTAHYYTPAGDSLKRLFLKSPLRFVRITSGYSTRRFHPILKVRRPHHGIDYGAPRGTPVMAVGDGEITFAARSGASGNMISLKHTNVYETQYKHLSRFATGIAPGTKVKSGQVIGYVGATGRATGPHLHFEFHVNGHYADPASIQFPAADPVPAKDLEKFKVASSQAVASLPPWSSGSISQVQVEQLAE